MMWSRRRAGLVYPALAITLAVPLVAGACPDKGKTPQGDASRGRRLFRTTAACSGCHQVDGHGGKLGPDLSRIGAKHDAHFIAAKVYNPKLGKPDTEMPSSSSLGLTDKNVADIAAYLGGLK